MKIIISGAETTELMLAFGNQDHSGPFSSNLDCLHVIHDKNMKLHVMKY